jgi:thioredoxin-related protein
MYNNFRIQYLLFAILVLCSVQITAHSDDRKIISSTNLALDGKESTRSQRPILLLVSKTGCPYCSLLKREILEPMIVGGNYADKIIIREIILNTSTKLVDFDGTIIDASALAKRYGTNLTPTMLFLGPDGKELTEKIVGINTIELFSYYVDQAIDNAVSELRSK